MGNCGSEEKKSQSAPKPAKTTREGPAKQGTESKEEAQKIEKIEEKIEEDAAGKEGEGEGPAEVLMISGCMDNQTSADVSDVAAILKEKTEAAVQGAGGACTSSLLHVTGEHGVDLSWRKLLQEMQGFLKSKEYTQVPQLSSTIEHTMTEGFSIHGGKKGKKYAMLTGINYEGTKAELSGCRSDVERMIGYLRDAHGFSVDNTHMKVFVDPSDAFGEFGVTPKAPTKENLLAGIEWIIKTIQPGDVCFFHYSGHGTQVPDDDGSEEDGKDEALVPLDYSTAKFITDDDIFNYLVSKVPKGARLFALMDCCHSGTIFDLPFSIKADESLSDADCVASNHAAYKKLEDKTAKKLARPSRQ